MTEAAPRLRWVQTTTAGVDESVGAELRAAGHVAVTCIKGPPGPMMAEHAVLLMLALARDFPTYIKNQENHVWRREGQEWPPLHRHTVAIWTLRFLDTSLSENRSSNELGNINNSLAGSHSHTNNTRESAEPGSEGSQNQRAFVMNHYGTPMICNSDG